MRNQFLVAALLLSVSPGCAPKPSFGFWNSHALDPKTKLPKEQWFFGQSGRGEHNVNGTVTKFTFTSEMVNGEERITIPLGKDDDQVLSLWRSGNEVLLVDHKHDSRQQFTMPTGQAR